MADSKKAIEMILIQEGGYVDHPADRGGATNFGITQRTYEDFVGRPVSKDEIRNMPRGNAMVIYKEKYWDEVRGDEIKDDGVAYVLFDLAVHSGPSRAVKQMQKLYGLPQTGVISDDEIRFINGTDPGEFIDKYLSHTLQWYLGIVDRNPTQSVFLRGWENRVKKARNFAYKVSSADEPSNIGVWMIGLTALSLIGMVLFKYRSEIAQTVKTVGKETAAVAKDVAKAGTEGVAA